MRAACGAQGALGRQAPYTPHPGPPHTRLLDHLRLRGDPGPSAGCRGQVPGTAPQGSAHSPPARREPGAEEGGWLRGTRARRNTLCKRKTGQQAAGGREGGPGRTDGRNDKRPV